MSLCFPQVIPNCRLWNLLWSSTQPVFLSLSLVLRSRDQDIHDIFICATSGIGQIVQTSCLSCLWHVPCSTRCRLYSFSFICFSCLISVVIFPILINVYLRRWVCWSFPALVCANSLGARRFALLLRVSDWILTIYTWSCSDSSDALSWNMWHETIWSDVCLLVSLEPYRKVLWILEVFHREFYW